MRAVPPDLAAHLAGDVTTLCRCWRVLRRDGLALGFTDHDRDLAFDVPVRFDTDELDIDLSAFDAGEIPKIPLVEIIP